MTLDKDSLIVITGIAGLVGQNLALRLRNQGYTNIAGIDKNGYNLNILKEHQPNIQLVEADIADQGGWEHLIGSAKVVILNQAQIGGLEYNEFHRNNVVATQNILKALDKMDPAYIVHISSSVVNSQADDYYTKSKTEQEEIVTGSGLPHCVLRPTLMFGWFDRKHLGWLRRFMSKVPVFPIPGNGQYRRQPLYVGDLCNVIIRCCQMQPAQEIYDISGQETLDYIDLIRTIKAVTDEKVWILKIPYWLFFILLWLAAKVVRNPPFTVHQLRALVIPEVFPVIDWPRIFNIDSTSFRKAVDETFNHPEHSNITLQF
jgi:nucleoside-diphosphate-sugar epimerase